MDGARDLEVSALLNAVSLRFKEGQDFYAFSTHFPSLDEVKNLAQVRIEQRRVIRSNMLWGGDGLSFKSAGGVRRRFQKEPPKGPRTSFL